MDRQPPTGLPTYSGRVFLPESGVGKFFREKSGLLLVGLGGAGITQEKGSQMRVFMPRIESRSLVWASAAFLGLWVFLGQGQEAAANLSYRMLWETNENDEGRLLQSYDHRLSFNLGQSLTDRVSATENINYNYRWQQEGEGRETVSPRATLSTSGDIFFSSLSVNSLRNLNSQSSQTDSDTLALTWASRWEKKFVPELLLNYDYSRSSREVNGHLNEDDRQAFGGEVNWDFRLAKVFYSYRRNDSTIQNYQTIQDSHLAKINAQRAWLAGRLRVAAGHEYGETRSERLFNFSTATTATPAANPTGVLVGTDTTPAAADDSTDTLLLPAPYLLNDLNPLLAPAYTVIAGTSDNCLVLDNNNGQQIDHVYLYTLANTPTMTLGLTWSFYSHDIPNTPWLPMTGVAPPTYDTTNQRFVIVMPAVKAAYIKIVVKLDLAVPNLDFTEVQADRVLHGAIGSTLSMVSDSINNKSNFSLDYKINKAMAFYYSLLLENNELDGITQTELENHSSGLRLQNSAGDLKSNLSYSISRNRYTTNPEFQTDTYHLDISKVFLPTLTAALGGTHEKYSQAGALLYTRNSYTFYADARLYPDLTSRLDVNYSEQEDFNSASGGSLTDSLRSQFSIGSRLRPSLYVSLSDTYEAQNKDNSPSSKRNAISLSGSWQASEWFSLNGAVQKADSNSANDAYSYSAGLTVGLGAGLELKANYSLQEAATRSQSGLATLRWSSRRNVSWEVGCNFAESEAGIITNVYKMYSRLQVNFATR